MIDAWISRFMAGVELRDPAQLGPIPLDFLVSNESQTLCFTIGWWRREWGQGGDGTLVIPAPFADGRFDGLRSGLLVSDPTDEDIADVLRIERQRVDVSRGEYLANLQRLRDYEPDFDFNPWTEAVLARPAFSLVRKLHERREIGRVRLLDATGRVRDALVIDSLGQAATVLDGGWLGLFAEQWSGYAEGVRPGVLAYLSWVVTRPVYDPGAVFEAPTVTFDAGPLATFLERDATSYST